MLSGSARAQALFSAISSANPNLAQASAAERQALQTALAAICGADVAYLTGAVVVNPTALVTPAGGLVTTAGTAAAQSGTVTTPVAITGTGTIS